jgi:hypothetical protein
MAKRRYEFDEAKIARFLKEGRGKGSGADYKPWLTIQDVSSSGRVSRLRGWKTNRLHHLLSDHETALFLLLEWSDVVLDIREQFPLDRDITRRIAADMGVAHPADPRTRVDLVMTTDFLVDVQTPQGSRVVARAVKPSTELENPRVIEKMEIKRRYWGAKGVEWGIVTELELPKERVKNIRWVHEMYSLEGQVVPHPDYWQDRCDRLIDSINSCATMTVKQFLRWLENTQGFASGDGLTAIRHLIATKNLKIDMDAPFDTSKQVGQVLSGWQEASERRRA